MVILGKAIRLGSTATLLLLLAGVTMKTQGQVGVGDSFGAFAVDTGAAEMPIRRKMLCAGYNLAEAQEAQPNRQSDLSYRLVCRFAHGQEQEMIEVNWVNNPLRWNRLIPAPHLHLRGAESLFEELTAEKDLFDEAEASSTLPLSDRDMSKVTILE